MAERVGLKAYGARIDLVSGAVTPVPGDTAHALHPTGAITVGGLEYEARALRSSRAPHQEGDYAGQVTVEERDPATHVVKRSWKPIQHAGFYDDCKIELHAEGHQLTIQAHFLTYM